MLNIILVIHIIIFKFLHHKILNVKSNNVAEHLIINKNNITNNESNCPI